MDNIMQYIPLAVSAVLLAALILTVVTNIITQVLKKLTWGKDTHQHSGLSCGDGRDPSGVLRSLSDHGVGRHLVHGGRSSSPGLVRRLRRYVWI